jgi:hypothetical protein
MAYSKAKFKSSGVKASPSFKQFWIGKLIGQVFTYTDFTAKQNKLRGP